MNTRVLELIKNPKMITESDLNLLESETEKMPYAQSLRALYLYGINLYQTEHYKENLSKTAAYTTDKKILYHFISSQKTNVTQDILPETVIVEEKSETSAESENLAEKDVEKINRETEKEVDIAVINKFDVSNIIDQESAENKEYIIVAGEKNRLLYEGEENFLEEKAEEIDMEATKESGVIIVKEDLKVKENLIVHDENRSEETIAEHKNVEQIIDIPEEKAEVKNADEQVQDEDSSGNISFNGIEDFMPQVKFAIPKNHLDYLNPPKREVKSETVSKAENSVVKTEIKKEDLPEIPENEVDKSQISFGNTQAFDVVKKEVTEPVIAKKVEKNEEDVIVNQKFPEVPTTELKEVLDLKQDHSEPVSEWKPMSFSNQVPDSLIGKKDETVAPEPVLEIKAEKSETEIEKVPAIEQETNQIEEEEKMESAPDAEKERPVMNFSFFGNEVSKVEKEKEIPPILPHEIEKEFSDSNVGTFINTWQSWLKIDRPKEAEKTIVVKEKIIDQFIEKNPKISQLKDEVSFVVKEKKDDISHLMTETLARLYGEQKLYAKAIKAYEILIEKHPQKADYFREKIEEIKETRKS